MKKLFILILICSALLGDDTSLKKAIGQMVVVGFSGTNANDRWIDQLVIDARSGRLGGVLISNKNIGSKAQLKALTAKFKAANLLTFVTDEGGKNSVFSGFSGFYHSENAAKVGGEFDLIQAEKTYDDAAKQLANLGIDVNLAPTINQNLGERSFSEKIGETTAYASQFIKSHAKFNISCALKYFPSKNAPEQGEFDMDSLKPYFDLIKRRNADFIMISSDKIPSLDNANSANESPKIVTNMLKNSFKFTGIAMSDDLSKISLNSDEIGKIAVNSVKAGVDMIIIGSYFLKGSNAVKCANDAIFNAVKSGEIPEFRILDATQRIENFKSRR